MTSSASRKIILIADMLHERMTALATQAEVYDPAFAEAIRNCKLDLANTITAVVLELQIEAMQQSSEREVGR